MQSRTLKIFPLPIVLFEFETLNLHIFEPRYKTLIADSFRTNETFGIPTVIDKKIMPNGAEVEVLDISKVHTNGELDIVVKVISRFEIIEVLFSSEANTAHSAIVNPIAFTENAEKELDCRIFDLLQELYEYAEVEAPANFNTNTEMLNFVHKSGLSLSQEFEMVALQNSYDRQLFWIQQLKQIVAAISEIQNMKKAVKLNGHFKKYPQAF